LLIVVFAESFNAPTASVVCANAEDENATAMPKARRDLNVFILNSLCRVEIEYASIISNIMLNEKTA